MKQAVHNGRASGIAHQLALITNQPARWRMKHNALTAMAGWAHVTHFSTALRKLLNHNTGIGLINVNDNFFDGLQPIASFISFEHHAWAPNSQLKAFAAHHFNQNAKLQFATTSDLKGIGFIFRSRYFQCHIALGFTQQTLTDDARLNLVAFFASQRSVIDAECHGERRRINRLSLDWNSNSWISNGVSNCRSRQA